MFVNDSWSCRCHSWVCNLPCKAKEECLQLRDEVSPISDTLDVNLKKEHGILSDQEKCFLGLHECATVVAAYTVARRFLSRPCPHHHIDTSASPKDKGELAEELKRADALVLAYACDQPESLNRFSYFLASGTLPIRVPVILVGSKLDLIDDLQQVGLEQVMSPIMPTVTID